MKKNRIAFCAAALLAAALLASCALFGSRGDTGTVTVSIGRGAGAKAGGVSPEFLPIFTSLTLSVSGPDMAPVSGTVSLGDVGFETPEQAAAFVNLLSASLDVPAGSGRVVSIYAPVDWDLTKAYYDLVNPTSSYSYLKFVKAYGGRAVVNVEAGGTTNVAIRLEVAETKIPLPDASDYGFVRVADSLSDPEPTSMTKRLDTEYDLEFDRYGYLYFSDADGILQYSAPEANAVYSGTHGHIGVPSNPLAYDKRNDQFFFLLDGELRESLHNTNISLDGGSFYDNALAVDAEGYVYASLTQGESYPFIAKLSVVGGTAAIVRTATYESLGLGYREAYEGESWFYPLHVADMQVKDGRLYIAAGEHDGTALHHGKIVEAALSDLEKLREIGWSSTTPTNPDKQFYGPTRFLAVAPRKLIVADEGAEGAAEVDRVVEVDLDSWEFGGIGLEGAVSFFNDYAFVAH